MFTEFDCRRQREFLDGLQAEIDWQEKCGQNARRARALHKQEAATLEMMERHPMPDCSARKEITSDTRFALTPAGHAALDAAPQAARLTRKRRLIPALAAKRIRKSSTH